MTDLDGKDLVIGIIGGLIFGFLVLYILKKDVGPLLTNEPCAPAHPVYVDGEKVGCTNDRPSKFGWSPEKDYDCEDMDSCNN